MDLAAKKYSFSFSCITLPLISLAIPPQLKMIITTIKINAEPYGFLILSPNAAFRTIAKIKNGNNITNSVILINIVSVIPPK